MKLNWTTKLISFAVLALGAATVSHAQGAGPTGSGLKPNPTAKQHRPAPVQLALAKLSLTKDQKAKIKALVKTRNENVKAFRQQHLGDKKAIRQNAEEQQKTMLDGIKGVLSPADWDKFQDAYKEALAANHPGRKNKAAVGTGTSTASSSTSSSTSGSSSGAGSSSTGH